MVQDLLDTNPKIKTNLERYMNSMLTHTIYGVFQPVDMSFLDGKERIIWNRNLEVKLNDDVKKTWPGFWMIHSQKYTHSLEEALGELSQKRRVLRAKRCIK